MRTLTVLAAQQRDYDTETGVAIIVLALIGLAFWAATEFQLRSEQIDAAIDAAVETDRDAVAEVIGLIDQRRSATYAGEFADQVEARLRVLDGGAS